MMEAMDMLAAEVLEMLVIWVWDNHHEAGLIMEIILMFNMSI